MLGRGGGEGGREEGGRIVMDSHTARERARVAGADLGSEEGV